MIRKQRINRMLIWCDMPEAFSEGIRERDALLLTARIFGSLDAAISAGVLIVPNENYLVEMNRSIPPELGGQLPTGERSTTLLIEHQERLDDYFGPEWLSSIRQRFIDDGTLVFENGEHHMGKP